MFSFNNKLIKILKINFPVVTCVTSTPVPTRSTTIDLYYISFDLYNINFCGTGVINLNYRYYPFISGGRGNNK